MLWETNLDETEQYLVKPMLALETVQITDWPGRCVDSSRSTTRERETLKEWWIPTCYKKNQPMKLLSLCYLSRSKVGRAVPPRPLLIIPTQITSERGPLYVFFYIYIYLERNKFKDLSLCLKPLCIMKNSIFINYFQYKNGLDFKKVFLFYFERNILFKIVKK
jgi:hypothetical protein